MCISSIIREFFVEKRQETLCRFPNGIAYKIIAKGELLKRVCRRGLVWGQSGTWLSYRRQPIGAEEFLNRMVETLGSTIIDRRSKGRSCNKTKIREFGYFQDTRLSYKWIINKSYPENEINKFLNILTQVILKIR